MPVPFAHLHVHSHYSPLDGIVLMNRLLGKAKEMGQTAMAITDHGVMYGVIDFYTTAKDMHIKPLIGFEAYVAPKDRRDRTATDQYAYNHLTLIARSIEGYKNLSRLCSEGFLTGFYRYPRIDKEIMRQYSNGIVALSGCLRGEIPRLLLAGNLDEAEKAANWHRELYGDGNFFLEIMQNGLDEQKRILPLMRELSKRTGIPLVATADVHYILPEHKQYQDIMLCIRTGKFLSDENRLHAEAGCHLKSGDEMLAALPGFEDAVENTMRVVDICHVDISLTGFHLPKLVIPNGMTAIEYLSEICRDGLKKRYGDPLPPAVAERFEKEQTVIGKMGFPDYFLIVWDIVNFARQNGIPVGPGRGSAAGSIISYGLGITDIDPLKYGLFFERFLNEGRNEMPDIDLDFDTERRQEVVEHIISRYGAERCAKIIVFGCLSLKSGIKDVGRVMGVPLPRTDKLSKTIPNLFAPEPGETPLESALKRIPELRTEYDADPETKKLLDAVGFLDGVMRNPGIHAAGVLVADRDITDYGPLAAAREGEITTQYEMKALEMLGLCKIDVLGIDMLSTIKNAVEIIKNNRGVDIDMGRLPMDDKPTFEMLSRGDAKGVFQFESEGFRQLLSRLKPDVFEDLIAAVAIYRPGPLQFLDSFINRKHMREPIAYLHPRMEPHLKETYGLILYQEQVQALAQDLAHFTLSEGDLMRRAMSKKKADLMVEYREKFIKQAGAEIGKGVAEKIYDQIQHFAGYGFNKSHSACYALIAYQTAYLKCHFPREYMAALMTTKRDDTDDIVMYTADALIMGISVLPVDINHSNANFSVEGDNIRYALAAIKGVGSNAASAIELERRRGGPFRDVFEFYTRMDSRIVNKGAAEALIKSGAMDVFGVHRARLAAGLESAMNAGVSEQRAKASGQLGLFSSFGAAAPSPKLPELPEWPEQQKLQFEKDVLGFYSSSHPLAEHMTKLDAFATSSISGLADLADGATVVVGGMLAKIILKNDKNNKRFASFELEDMGGKARGVVFAQLFEGVKEALAEDRMVFIEARLDKSRDEPSLVAKAVIPIEEAEERLAVRAVLNLSLSELEGAEVKLNELRELVGKHQGDTRLFFRLLTPEGRVDLRAGDRYSLRPTRELIDSVHELFGHGTLRLGGRRGSA